MIIVKKINPLLRSLNSSLMYQIRRGFSQTHTHYLDPSKHITMSHHIQNIYIDQYDIGQYPQVILQHSIAAKTYEPIVVSTLTKVLNQRYGSNITQQMIYHYSSKQWSRFFSVQLKSKDSFKDILSSLLRQLSNSIIIRESRWTWCVEQKYRLQYSLAFFNTQKVETVQEFLKLYNTLIEQLVIISNMGFSKIEQPESALQKHYAQQMESHQSTGIPELQEDREENKTFINNLMRLIHQ